MRTREQLQAEYNEALEYGDFYKAQDLKDEFEAMDKKNMHEKALLTAGKELPNLLKKMKELYSEINTLKATIKQYEEEIEANLQLIPGCIRVCEGGGPENLRASLAVNVANLLRQIEFTPQREASLEKAAKSLLEKNPNFLDVVGERG